MDLYIAEKPSVARELAGWLEKQGHGKAKKENTYIQVGPDHVVSWCFGHVLEQVEPHEYDERYKQWRLEHLPIIPAPFRLRPKPDAEAQVRALKALLAKADRVVHAGDPDEEGQLLVSEVLNYFNFKKPVLRLWLNAIDETSISRAMASMKPDAAYKGYYESALARSEADWLFGINFTRLITIHGRRCGAESVISVGRVQTPTLALIVAREHEIQNFKPKDFYTPWISLATAPPFRAKWITDEADDRLDPEGYLIEKKAADAIVAKTQGADAVVTAYSATKKTESAPLPFSLSSLQTLMSSKYGLGAAKVLEAAQKLYEQKLTSYPRTDCEYLIEAQHADAGRILASLQRTSAETDRALAGAKPMFRSRAWNDKNATAHHGIIPLVRSGDLPSLSREESLVYIEVVKRYILQFWPTAEYLETKIELKSADERFAVSGKTWTAPGWRNAFKKEAVDEDEEGKEEAEASLPQLKKGDVLKIAKAGMDASRTKAPKRYTEGTLLTAMKSIHKFVQNEKLKAVLKEVTGIGTEATRANVIETLFKRGYVGKKGKDLVPTAFGTAIIGLLPKHLTAPDMTAYWQQKMDMMKAGEGTHELLVREQEAFLKKIVPTAAAWFEGAKLGDGKPRAEVQDTEHICPTCKKAHLRRIKGKYGWFFGCSDQACKAAFNEVDGKPVARVAPKQSEHKCAACKAPLTERSGQYGPYFKCSKDTCGAIYKSIDGVPEKTHACPKCKKGRLGLRKGPKGAFWGCSRFKDGCKHTVNDKNGEPEIN